MRAGLALMARPPADQQLGSGLQWLTQFGTLAEKLGFAGIWVTDSVGRGRHTLDPTVTLGALHAGTSRIGGEQVRTVRFENGGMVLAPPRRLYANVMQHQELFWERVG